MPLIGIDPRVLSVLFCLDPMPQTTGLQESRSVQLRSTAFVGGPPAFGVPQGAVLFGKTHVILIQVKASKGRIVVCTTAQSVAKVQRFVGSCSGRCRGAVPVCRK